MVEIKEEACPRIELNSGHSIPQVSLGTFKISENCTETVKQAVLTYGYRHLDCAKVYENEEEVGQAIEECIEAGVPREDLFVTSKLWHTDKGDVEAACRESLRKLKLEYLDLYLIHWMTPGLDTEGEQWKTTGPPQYLVWKAMEDLVAKGLVKSIGVSNATAPILIDIIAGAEIVPAVNQIEVHPYNAQPGIKNLHDKFGIKIECYSSIGAGAFQGKQDKIKDVMVIKDPVITEIAEAKKVSPAQVTLRWHIQRGLIPLVKTSKVERLGENMDLFSFELSDDEMEAINGLDQNMRFFNPRHWGGSWGNIPYYGEQ